MLEYDLAAIAVQGLDFLAAFIEKHPEYETDIDLLMAMEGFNIVGRQIVTARAMADRHVAEAEGDPYPIH